MFDYSLEWDGYEFKTTSLESWEPPSYGGIYAIMYKELAEAEEYVLLYFGETGDFSKCKIDSSHHKYDCWATHGYSYDDYETGIDISGEKIKPSELVRTFFIGIYKINNASRRGTIKRNLIKKYKPKCNLD